MSRTFPRPRSFTPGRSVCMSATKESLTKKSYWNASVHFHRDNLGDTRFFHSNSVQVGCCFHCTLAVRNDDELCRRAHFAHHLGESIDVGVIERSIDFIEDAKGARLITEERDQQRQRCQCFFAARQQQYILKLLARWLRNDLHTRIVLPPLPIFSIFQ